MMRAPSSAPTPYIEMDPSSSDFSTATEDGQDIRIDLHVWHQPGSQTPETATTMAIIGHVRRILHTASLTLANPYNCILCRVINQVGPMTDPDGATLHGVVSLRLLVDHT